jgi:hypothetical protein
MPKSTSRKESQYEEVRPPSESLLAFTLAAAVPIWILRLRELSDEERQERSRICGDWVAFHGDHLLYRGPKPGDTAEVFNRLAEGIGCLAFCPGGVTTFGQHFDASTFESGVRETASTSPPP